MPWPRSTVPKFGNWDKNEELSYSIVFDKVRAEKERFLHDFKGDLEDTSLDQSFEENGNVGAAKKTSHSIFSDKAREDRERVLHTPQEDKIYTPQYPNVLKNSELVAGRGTSHASYDKSWGLHTTQEDKIYTLQHPNVLKNSELVAGRGTSHASYDKSWGLLARASGNSTPKSSSGGRFRGEQQHPSTLQADPWGLPESSPYNASFPSGAPSRQPMQIGATKENTFFNERQRVDQEDNAYHGRLHAIPTNAPDLGRHMYEENPAAAKLRSPLKSSETTRKADMQGKHVLPKFGDWDSGVRFTAAFSRVQNERRSKHILNPTVKASSPVRPVEDLYKTSEGSSEGKKRRGWRPILCCSKP